MKRYLNRRDFIRASGIVTAGGFFLNGTRTHVREWAEGEPARAYAANDQVQIALIGAGGQGMQDTRTALAVLEGTTFLGMGRWG